MNTQYFNIQYRMSLINMRLFKITVILLFVILFAPLPSFALPDFNPHYIISDAELQDANIWTRNDVQNFLDNKGSYLRNYTSADASGAPKAAADIISEAAKTYGINPKFLLVTLQKEQSLITDDNPTPKQLDWATGYAVCDGCYLSDPEVQKHKGFGKQVDNAAGLMRWYYDNKDTSAYVKKKDTPIRIDGSEVVPQSWATAFLYTYTPHLHGNKNFHRIWNTWFGQNYPDGTLLQSASSSEVWLIQNNKRRKFASRTILLTRADPKMIIAAPETELSNYEIGPEISFPNYSLLKTASATYLLDYDTLRPFASDEVVRKLGYNPQELIEVTDAELTGYATGSTITAETVAPQGVIYQIVDLNNGYYLLKDGLLHPILDKRVVSVNFSNLKIEKHRLKEISSYAVADLPITFSDGTLMRAKDSQVVFVLEKGKKRRVADDETFAAMGYKRANIVSVDTVTVASIPEGEALYLNSSLLSAKNKFLGDSEALVKDLYGSKLPAYLVAEYPGGRVISGKNIDERRPMASLVKLLTANEALTQEYNFKKATTYKKKEYASEGNPLQLIDGEKIKNSDLFYAMLVGSVNNAARMVANGTGMDEEFFVASVNARLQRWGADNTEVADVTGLDKNNKTTPRDLLKIFTKILGNDTIKTALAKEKYYFTELTNKNKIKSHTVKNTNQLLAKPGRNYRILAGKTGYTDEAGAVLLMLVESKKTKKQYIVATMGNGDYKRRFDEPNKIATWIAKGEVTVAANR